MSKNTSTRRLGGVGATAMMLLAFLVALISAFAINPKEAKADVQFEITKFWEDDDDAEGYSPVETVNIPVKKVWDDEGDRFGIRPDSVAFCVFNRDVRGMTSGGAISNAALGNPFLASSLVGKYEFGGEGDEWEYTIQGLPKFDGNGNEITYCVLEVFPGGGNGTYAPSAYENLVWDKENSVVITNSPITEDITIVKVWDDGENEAGERPNEITVRLMKGDEELDRATLSVNDATVYPVGEGRIPNENGDGLIENDRCEIWGWYGGFAFEGFPMYEKDGTQIDYTIAEEPIRNYAHTGTMREIKPITYYLTNTYTAPRIEWDHFTVYKVWDDEGHEDERPESVTIGVYETGSDEAVAVETLTADDTYVIGAVDEESAPAYADMYKAIPVGTECWMGVFHWAKNPDESKTYEVREVVPEGYEVSYSDVFLPLGKVADKGIVVTNTYIQEEPEPEPETPATPETKKETPKQEERKVETPRQTEKKDLPPTGDSLLVAVLAALTSGVSAFGYIATKMKA